VEVGLAALLAPPPAFLAEAAVAAVVHLWSQRCVTRRIMLYGLVDIEARYLSVASVGLKFLLSDAWPVEQILGITAAQLYHLASEDSKALAAAKADRRRHRGAQGWAAPRGSVIEREGAGR